jgi:O-antigen/teichoic acid export membrane protein
MRRSIYLSLAGQWSSAAMSVVASILVARMMQPAELGIFTMRRRSISRRGARPWD